MYRQRCLGQELCYIQFKKEVMMHKNIEKYYATKNEKLSQHNKKWGINVN